MYHPHYKKRESKTSFVKSLDAVVFIVAAVGPLMTIPQAVSIYNTQDVTGVSSVTWSSYVFTSGIWLTYGWVHKEKMIILNSFLGGILSFLIFFGTVLYR